MERVVQVIGGLLLIAVLFLGVMTYANVAGISNVLDYIKAGVGKLVGWLVPANFSVDIAPLGDATLIGGTKTVVLTVSQPGSYDVATVSIKTDKALKVAIKVGVSGPIAAEFSATVSESNAIVLREVEQTDQNSYVLILRVYPAFDEAKDAIPENVTGYTAYVTVTISATVIRVSAPGNIIVAVSEATYI